MTAIATPTAPANLSRLIEFGRTNGPEAMRELWRANHLIVNNPDTPEDVAAAAADLEARIELAAKHLKEEAIERAAQAAKERHPAGTATGKAQIALLSRALPDLPHAYYAVEHEGTLKFFRVDKPTEGKWKGYTFLKVQASDDLHPIKALDYKIAVFTEIAKDPQGAMERYGREIGRCGHCHRTLTNEESRARGIGPVCAGRMGW